MIESPLIQELLAERMHKAILGILRRRFATVPEDIASVLPTITDDDRLQVLAELAGSCPDLETFRQQIVLPT